MTTDNSDLDKKVLIRNHRMPKKKVVLDLYCGLGEIYKRCYQDTDYTGVDNKKVHSHRLCHLAENKEWVRNNDITKYTVFDLDAYASPWPLFYLICKKLVAAGKHGQKTFFLTDGLRHRLALNQHADKNVSAMMNVRQGQKIPGLYRIYPDIIAAFLRTMHHIGVTTDRFSYLTNNKKTMYINMLIRH